ncbi:splicing factor 3B subunit 1-like [Dorcoceras hygrometricum]|uniref:Splicing factor 3B subunit 1-like n=1 Tax=Dorcoceras hygrometricum TaxID=472368 RepID=A0A2Z7ADI9_9LAMI|nr:splicing factor 3B subunit 1-like [Dorcoceras hygrometricum]
MFTPKLLRVAQFVPQFLNLPNRFPPGSNHAAGHFLEAEICYNTANILAKFLIINTLNLLPEAFLKSFEVQQLRVSTLDVSIAKPAADSMNAPNQLLHIYCEPTAEHFFDLNAHLSRIVYFDSILRMEHEGMVAMFEALLASRRMGFLGCSSAIHEAALVEFFHNASVRDGKVVSTVQGKPVSISEELFARTFELSLEGLTDIHDVPKDLVFEARIAFSYDGKLLSTSCKKREITFEFWLLNDILAKSVTMKAGSFDVVTHERFLMMSAIHGGVQVNWGRFLFNIFKDMVTPASRQAQGYAVQICILLKNAPDLELAVEKPVEKKKAVSKKRPATTVEEPVVKRKRTMGRAAPEAKSLALVTVAQEAVPIQMENGIFGKPSLTRSDDIIVEITKRSISVNDEDDNLDGAENEIARKMESFTTPKQFLKEPLIFGEDDDMSGSKKPSKIIEPATAEKDKEIEPVATDDLSLAKSVETMTDSEDTEPWSKVLALTDNFKSDEESMSIEDILKRIPVDLMLPSVTAAEPTIIKFALGIEIPGVNQRDCQQDPISPNDSFSQRHLDTALTYPNPSISTDSRMFFTTDDIPLGVGTTVDQILIPTVDVTTKDFTEPLAQLRASVNQIQIVHVQKRDDTEKLNDVLLLHIRGLEQRFTKILEQQDRTYQGLFAHVRQEDLQVFQLDRVERQLLTGPDNALQSYLSTEPAELPSAKVEKADADPTKHQQNDLAVTGNGQPIGRIVGREDPHERFIRQRPLEFSGLTNPLVAESWIKSLEVIFDYLHLTDQERPRCAIYMLRGDAMIWWEGAKLIVDLAMLN